MKNFILYVFTLQIVFVTLEGACPPEGCSLHTTLYNNLKCVPVYKNPTDCCPSEYDCSHIYNRSKNTCHYKGKIYKSQERIDREEISGSCKHNCYCETGNSKPHFECPPLSDICAEYWVGGYPKPRCYLRYEVNKCCSSDQICPPFDNNAKCEVEGKTYKEGELFDQPNRRCTRCSCEKGFDGKFEAPACQELLCFAELKHSNDIDQYCAPHYKSSSECCPDKWICPSKSGKVLPSSEQQVNKHDLKCKFGEETIPLGGSYVEKNNNEEILCECVLPPLLTCGSKSI